MAAVTDFTMPSLGADMTEGTLIEWLVKPGDAVRRGDVVAVVDTDKAAIEVEVFTDGVVDALLVEPGTLAAVGTPLARIVAGAEASHPTPQPTPEPPAKAAPEPLAHPEPHPEPEPEPEPVRAPVTTPAVPEPAEPAGRVSSPAVAEPVGPAGRVSSPAVPGPAEPAGRVPSSAVAGPVGPAGRVSSPLVRHLAEETGVDLTAVRGTGPAGRITRTDVRRARRPRVTPLARRLAAESGVDLARVRGSGAGGVIKARDVRRAATSPPSAASLSTAAPSTAPPSAAPPSAPATSAGKRGSASDMAAASGAATGRAATGGAATGGAATGRAATGGAARGKAAGDRVAAARLVTARLMERAKREIPHFYLSHTIDLGPCTAWMRDRNRELPVSGRLVSAAPILRAVALAAVKVPELNGFWLADEPRPAERVNLGVAVSLRGGGLVTPVIPDAAALGVEEVMARLRDLVTRARAGRLRGSDLSDATLTVTNLGDQGVELVHGVIYPPQVALVGVGRVVSRVWPVDGEPAVRPVVTITLSADHRAADGHTGSRFLTTIERLLNNPEELS